MQLTVWAAPALATGAWLAGGGGGACGFVNRLNKTWLTPGASSDQTTFRLPFVSATICPSDEKPESFETFCAAEKNVAPASVERVKKMLALPGVLSIHTRLVPPAASTFITALIEFPGLFDTFVVEKLAPPSLECAKYMSLLKAGGTLSCHAT